jgi:hypothetical protein
MDVFTPKNDAWTSKIKSGHISDARGRKAWKTVANGTLGILGSAAVWRSHGSR